jgi:LacI family transcriptional regulator
VKNARIKDIALLAGVSIGTVDRVLHNRGEVAEQTRIRIQQILKETNYSPNLMAKVLKMKRKYHLVSLLPGPTENNSFWLKHPQGMARALEELYPFPVALSQVTFDILDEKDYQEKLRLVIDLKPDGVLLAPIFKSESTAFCSILTRQGIPLVFVDGFIEKARFLAYTGEDPFKSGRVAGQLTDMITPENKDILVINMARNIRNVHHLRNRSLGFLNYLEAAGKNRGKKIELNITEPSHESIAEALDKAFKNSPEIASVFMTGSKSHLIASYLEEKNLHSVNLVGYDLLDLNVRYLKSGIIKFLIGQRPEEQTLKGVKKLFEFLSLNKAPEKMEYLPVDIITSENVDYFV